MQFFLSHYIRQIIIRIDPNLNRIVKHLRKPETLFFSVSEGCRSVKSYSDTVGLMTPTDLKP